MTTWSRIPNQFIIASGNNILAKLARRGYTKVVAEELGWKKHQLSRLAQTLHQLLFNLELITRIKTDIVFAFTKDEPDDKDMPFKINVKEKKIFVHLKAGPKKFSDQFIIDISRALVDLFFETRGEGLINLSRLNAGTQRISNSLEEGLQSLKEFYNRRRKITPLQDILRGNLIELAEKLGGEILRRQILISLLRPRALHKREIQREIDASIPEIAEGISKVCVDTGEINTWVVVAHLAMLSALAMKNGLPEAYKKIRGLIFHDISQDLCLVRALEIGLASSKYFLNHPLETSSQIQAGMFEFDLLFDIFLRISGYYYDNVHLLVKFFKMYADKI